jgi:hypothetical protein
MNNLVWFTVMKGFGYFSCLQIVKPHHHDSYTTTCVKIPHTHSICLSRSLSLSLSLSLTHTNTHTHIHIISLSHTSLSPSFLLPFSAIPTTAPFHSHITTLITNRRIRFRVPVRKVLDDFVFNSSTPTHRFRTTLLSINY